MFISAFVSMATFLPTTTKPRGLQSIVVMKVFELAEYVLGDGGLGDEGLEKKDDNEGVLQEPEREQLGCIRKKEKGKRNKNTSHKKIIILQNPTPPFPPNLFLVQ